MLGFFGENSHDFGHDSPSSARSEGSRERKDQLTQKPWIVPIPGTTKIHRLEENIGSASVELTSDDLDEINEAASRIPIQGERLPESILRMSYR